jgi:hypothetical protein
VAATHLPLPMKLIAEIASSVVTEIVAKLSMKFTPTQIGSGHPRGRQPSSPNTRRFDAVDDEGAGEHVDLDLVFPTVGAN